MATKSFPMELSRVEGLGSVTMCGCGVVSLHLAGVTLRLQASALSQIDHLLHSALESLYARQALCNTTSPASTMTH